ncbi:bifunctional UDP-N-acetylglucosamine diphosphorylase/glucosamine-1-phosphate N-acetyltransferase GlmU [Helicobacter salomonis]|uniref:bifunctional UDP-N-acetylglucosamine diphosphorylase/glucosamine-1-phosphate N-acetyltransferase GlmU n=1 Tax=Helicobacter salomonis TaxID=56878 RepID=UPI000CF19031|nr:bifunctional UDP-N-acetylglucosamine diphosphorylase/glucosamine-1-phosphate N-acetyltransferase GlmU [Helicobacter salomonis]
MNLSVIILAAGKGTRMKSPLPKVLHKLCGREMLVYVLESALALSDDVHVVLAHQHARIHACIQEAFAHQSIHIHLQDVDKFPGTGGALLENGVLLPTAHEKILILNADMPLINPSVLQPLLEHPHAIGIFEREDACGYGRVRLENGLAQAIIEEKDASKEVWQHSSLNAGIYVFSREFLQTYLLKLDSHNAQREYYLTQLVELGARAGVEIVGVYVSAQACMGVNSLGELSQAQEALLARLRQEAMDAGVQMEMPHTIYLDSQVRFEGSCVLEQGVRLAGACVLKNAHIKAHSVIEESIIEESSIGPLAHVRPGCYISHSHVGNFVETKNAQLKGVKAGHLSYLGDCSIDEGSNIGAGVITCNYDGRSKYSTKIGKHVFVGSDSQLIAPLDIPSHVLIGAGSTITQQMQEGDLVLSRTPQTNKTGGYFKFFKS